MTEMISYCDDYGGQPLENFIRYIPHARKKLEQIRIDILSGSIPE